MSPADPSYTRVSHQSEVGGGVRRAQEPGWKLLLASLLPLGLIVATLIILT
jgi:hypothetical protein